MKYTVYYIVFLTIYLVKIFMNFHTPELVINFMNVGQGDAIYIGNFLDLNILVDGGPTNDAFDYLSDFFIYPFCTLDRIFITHPHDDHTLGLIPFFRYCYVRAVTFNDVSDLTKNSDSFYFIKTLFSTNTRKNFSSKKYEYGNLRIFVLWPPNDFDFEKVKDLNQTSLVLLVDYEDKEFLLTGDAELSTLVSIKWSDYIPYIDNGLDVLKVGHHGSKKSISLDLLKLLNPHECVISVGTPNMYKHPNLDTLKTLEDFGCIIRRTDKEGSIEYKLD